MEYKKVDGKAIGLAASLALVALLPAVSGASAPSIKARLAEVRTQVAQHGLFIPQLDDANFANKAPKLDNTFANAPQP